MRASFRETHWLRALASLCAMIVSAFVLSACIPPDSVTQPCKEEDGREFRPPGICVPLHSCNAVSIAAGVVHSCAIVGPQTMCRSGDRVAPPDSSGACPTGASPITVGTEIRCWGNNSSGQLGDGTKTNRTSPTTVKEPPPRPGEVVQVRQYLQVAAGGEHTCALLVGGAVECWGENAFGQLGNGSTTPSSTPVAVTGLTDVVEIAAGDEHTCVRLSSGTVRCWGSNKKGELGNGSSTNSSAPVAVTGLTGVVEIAAGYQHTCARIGGTVRCWGSNSGNRFVQDQSIDRVAMPVAVNGLAGVVEITVGGEHDCARLDNGEVRCWGGNSVDQLANGLRYGGPRPFAVRASGTGTGNLTHVAEISAGAASTCARLTTGEVQCWGYGLVSRGQRPVTVPGLSDVAEIAVGTYYMCARLVVTGEVRCFGNNQAGQLGNRTFVSSPTPASSTLCCQAGTEACTSGCINLQTDNANCGACGNACAAGTQCTAGRCMPATACSTCVYSACAAAANACVADGACRTWLTTYVACADEACRRATMNASTALATAVTTCQANQCRSACEGHRLAAGAAHTCAIRQNADNTSGAVVCWGRNGESQLGVENAGRCEAAPGGDDAVEVVASQTFSCSRNAGGTVRCWGDPAPGLSVPNAVELVAGSRHVCARLSDGTVQCGGYAETTYMNGELGSSDGRGPVSGLTGVVELAAGANHTCARLAGGEVRCWGTNERGALGRSGAGGFMPMAVSGLSGVVEIAAGAEHTCARLASGEVRCWGGNVYGELGRPVEQNTTPMAVSGLPAGVGEIAAGGNATCAIVGMNREVYCWGSLLRSIGAMADPMPRQVLRAPGMPLRDAVEISMGGSFSVAHACARLRDGNVWCWGDNFQGQLGVAPATEASATAVQSVCTPGCAATAMAATPRLATTTACDLTCVDTQTNDRHCGRCGNACTDGGRCVAGGCVAPTSCDAPTVLCGAGEAARCSNLQSDTRHCGSCGNACMAGQVCSAGQCTDARATKIAAGGSHTCVVTNVGEVRCWGTDRSEQRGDGDATSSEVCSGPDTIPRPRENRAVEVAAGERHTCARLTDGTVRCWGSNADGQLADGDDSTRSTPVVVRQLTGVVEIAAAGRHTCARLTGGTVRCWGSNADGQLGGSSPTMDVPMLSGVVEIAAGVSHTCARLTGGTVRCWGWDYYGQLGGSSTTRDVPMLTGVVEIAVGSAHTCARLTGGTVRCWGFGLTGELGGSSTTDVPMLTGVAEITAGDSHTCARLTGGTVRCWGSNDSGQLGGSSPTMDVPMLTGVAEITAGGFHTCARLQSGEVRCWGLNDNGQLGDGTTTDRSTPVTATCTGATTCAMGQTACGTGCCGMGQTCMNNLCVTPMSSCGSGETSCPGVGCVNLMTNPSHCGACDEPCRTGEACVMGICTSVTTVACRTSAECPTGHGCCDNTCVDLGTSASNCGRCDNVCPAGESCTAGSCGATTCTAPSMICGAMCVDTRTSTAHCGRCDNPCSFPNAAAVCASSMCALGPCNTGFGDCDGMAGNGCETRLGGSDVNNCGGCARRCTFANAAASCASGACALGACDMGFGNCDMSASNGCETNTAADNANCGTCGRVCPTGEVCNRGGCATSCAAGTTNCSGDCVNTGTDPSHCGGCSRPCTVPANGSATCAGGSCGVACNTGFHNCGGACVSNAAVATCGASCTACPVPANAAATCNGMTCGFVCNTGFGDCDGMAGNGCETRLGGTDVNNCGGCGVVCRFANAAASCASGACALGACNAGFGNCDMDASNGCETDTNTSNAHCLACNNRCASGATCTASGCVGMTAMGDTCAMPLALSMTAAAQTVMGTTAGASSSAEGCAGGADVFYRFTLTRRELVYFDTFGTAFDTQLRLHTDVCATPVGTCSDDACSGTQSQLVEVLDAGTYVLAVDGATGAAGPFTLHVQHLPAGSGPVNPLASRAGPQTVMATSGGASGLATSCGGGGVGPEAVWWLATCPSFMGGAMTASTCGGAGFDTVVEQQSAARTPIAVCNDDTCGTQSTAMSTLPSGAGLHTVVADAYYAAMGGAVTVTVTLPTLGSCMPPEVPCGGTCVNTQTSPAHCGACNTACMAPMNAAPTCTGGRCDFRCDTGFTNCSGACRNLQTDNANCGVCSRVCTTGQTCVNGSCSTVARCPTGQTDCTPTAMTATCRNLQTDVSACGSCTRVCAAPTGGSATCSMGGCGQSCPSGQMVCGSACATLGGACTAGLGACLRSGMIACTGGSPMCDAVAGMASAETCNNVDDNCDGTVDNGATCPSGQMCVSGTCMGMTCAPGTTACGAACCMATQTCAGGACRRLDLAAVAATAFVGTTTSGSALTSACPANTLLTELNGIGPSPFPFPGAPIGFSTVWARCANASLNATPGVSLTGSMSTSATAFGRGVSGVGFPFITACPPGQAAIGIRVQTDTNARGATVPVGLQLRCAPIAVSPMGTGYVVGRGTVTDSPLVGSSGSAVDPVHCLDDMAGTNRFASGVRGHVYDMPMSPMDPASVEALALTCTAATISP